LAFRQSADRLRDVRDARLGSARRLRGDLGLARGRYAEEPDPSAEPEDYGLLSPATIARDRTRAAAVRRTLAAAGIRSTVAPRRDRRVMVLVFAEDADRAHRLVGGSPDRR
jgi:hypothetical protein